MTGLIALKPEYDRKTKTYSVRMVRNLNGSLGTYAQDGWLVTGCGHEQTIGRVISGSLIQSWPAAKRAAILKWLFEAVGSKTFINVSDDGTFYSIPV